MGLGLVLVHYGGHLLPIVKHAPVGIDAAAALVRGRGRGRVRARKG